MMDTICEKRSRQWIISTSLPPQMEIETIIYDMIWCILYNMIYYNHLNWLQVSSSSDGDADSGVDETTQGWWNGAFLDIWQRLWQHRNYDDCDDYDVMLIKKIWL